MIDMNSSYASQPDVATIGPCAVSIAFTAVRTSLDANRATPS